MDDSDPISQFFPGEDDVDLYKTLGLNHTANLDTIKKAYRRLALVYHPDKHVAASEQAKQDASTKFQQIGFAYAVLSDDKRKARYDTTGKTDEGFDLGAGEDGWETYFEELFDRVTRGKLDEMKKEYQGSVEEIEDLQNAFHTTKGNLGEIMTYIPHSSHDDESRFVLIINKLIKESKLQSTSNWKATSKDEKAKLVRKKQSEKEAKEAEEMAKELGVWDEFYGSGKPTEKKSKGKKKSDAADDEEAHSALQALILKKKAKNMDNFFDGLAAKYGATTEKSATGSKGKKRRNADLDEEEVPKKKTRGVAAPPEIDDEEFARLQEKLFNNNSRSSEGVSTKKGGGRKAT